MLEKDQAILLALAVVAEFPSTERMAFDGGTALSKASQGHRFSEDLDFTATSDVSSDQLEAQDRSLEAADVPRDAPKSRHRRLPDLAPRGDEEDRVAHPGG